MEVKTRTTVNTSYAKIATTVATKKMYIQLNKFRAVKPVRDRECIYIYLSMRMRMICRERQSLTALDT